MCDKLLRYLSIQLAYQISLDQAIKKLEEFKSIYARIVLILLCFDAVGWETKGVPLVKKVSLKQLPKLYLAETHTTSSNWENVG